MAALWLPSLPYPSQYPPLKGRDRGAQEVDRHFSDAPPLKSPA